MPESPFKTPVSWSIDKGEIWTVYGANGSGKSLLAEVIAGRYALQEGQIVYHFIDEMKQVTCSSERMFLPRDFIKIVHFNGVHSLAGFKEVYYQQRFNQSESDDIPFVSDLFRHEELSSVLELIDIRKLLNRRLNHLSSGELRKLLIAKALEENPRMLIFDNPFIGLDVESRGQLNDVFKKLSDNGMQLLFLVPSQKDIPDVTTHILILDDCQVMWKGKMESSFPEIVRKHSLEKLRIDWAYLSGLSGNKTSDYSAVVDMEDIEIAYGDIVINRDINWKIQKGEKWALLGPNGSGKSTLLSYIFADNPQAYAKKLYLFDRKRGSGESIWEIKKHIGFTSSEMHLYYRQHVSCLSVVSSGFFDSVGLYRKCTEEQLSIARYLFKVFGMEDLMERPFLKVSSGEQRIILFARALIKNPDLLILDEPFHGLDKEHKEFCAGIIESYCSQPDKSLIYVTHRQEEIPACVQHKICLKAYEKR